MNMNLSIFLVIFFAIFATLFLPKYIFAFLLGGNKDFALMKVEEYFFLFFATLLLIFFFGYFQMLITHHPSHLAKSFVFATFFLLWYFITKTIVNIIHRNSNNL
jgi:hypothetical protein